MSEETEMEIALEDTNSTNQSCSSFSSTQMLVLKILYLSGGSTSLFFCLVIFFISLLFHKYQQSTQRLVLYLTLTVSLLSVANILHGVPLTKVEAGGFCVAKAFIDQIASWMVLLAECCVTFEIFYKVVFLKFDTSRLEPVYCVIIFIVPFIFNWIPFIQDAYGPTSDQCWIRSTKKDDCTKVDSYYVSIRFILYWIPFVGTQIIIFIVYLSILILTRLRLTKYHGKYNPGQDRIRNMIYKEIRGYLLYPILLLIGSFVGVVARIVDEAEPNEVFFKVRIIHILAISFQGLAIALIFALDYDTRKQLKHCSSIKAAFYGLFCCCFYKKRQVSEYEALPGGSVTDSLRISKDSDTNIII